MIQSRLTLVLSLGVVFAGAACSSGASDGAANNGGDTGTAGRTSGSAGSLGSGGAGTTSGGSGQNQAGGSTPIVGGAGAGGAAPGSAGSSATGGASDGGMTAGGTGGGSAGSSGSPAGGSGGGAGAVPLDPTLLSKCTGTNPILCTIPVPNNGNYTVTVELGSATAASTSRVQAETYRIVVPELSLAAGAYSQQTFSVNVRKEVHDGYSAPEKVLNLRIDAAAPALHGLGFVAAPNIPTIFVAGDSTVCDWDPIYLASNPNTAGVLERGWAQELSQFFKPGIAVANYADSGETAPSFYTKFWGPAKALLRAGDYVFIQFGHNDQTDAFAGFSQNMLKYVTDAKMAQAIPVLFTPPPRKSGTTADPGFKGLDQQTRDLAKAQNVALVDLTALALAYYATLPNKSAAYGNPTESTHFSEFGATGLSKQVTTALKAGTLALKDFVR